MSTDLLGIGITGTSLTDFERRILRENPPYAVVIFGRNIGDTLGVTDSVWAVFVREVISARLPAGFTLWPAAGGWRDSTGRSTREPTFVLEVVHPVRAPAADSAIVGVVAEYKRRFHQQSVLRVVTAGRASF